MPFADPAMHEKRAPPVAELAMLNMAEGPELLALAGKGAPPRATTTTPLTIDAPTMARIDKALDDWAGKRFGTTFDKCEPAQKAEVLVAVLQVGGTFGLKYDRRMSQEPQKVMDFLDSKKLAGNCADFSRMLVAVAREKHLPVQMLSVTFQAQDGAREEEQHLAVFNTGTTIYYLDLTDPDETKRLQSYTGFTSTAALVKDAGFQGELLNMYGRAVKDGRTYKPAEEPKVLSDENLYEATYWADMGSYFTRYNKWKEAGVCLEKAEKLGLRTYWVNAELGAVYSKTGREDEAIARLEAALKMRESSSIYPYLADAHIGLAQKYKTEGRFDDARKELGIITANLEMKFTHGGAKHLLARIDYAEGLTFLKTDPERGISLLTSSVAAYRDAFTYYHEGDSDFKILKTGFANAYHDLAGAYANSGRIDEARKTLAVAITDAREKHLPIEGLLELEKELKRMK